MLRRLHGYQVYGVCSPSSVTQFSLLRRPALQLIPALCPGVPGLETAFGASPPNSGRAFPDRRNLGRSNHPLDNRMLEWPASLGSLREEAVPPVCPNFLATSSRPTEDRGGGHVQRRVEGLLRRWQPWLGGIASARAQWASEGKTRLPELVLSSHHRPFAAVLTLEPGYLFRNRPSVRGTTHYSSFGVGLGTSPPTLHLTNPVRVTRFGNPLPASIHKQGPQSAAAPR